MGENTGRRSRTNRDEKFFELKVNYKYNKDADVTFVDKFNCRVGDSALQFDDEFLVSASYVISHTQGLLSNHMSGVHPIFMKDSFIQARDEVAEQVNQDSILSVELTASYKSHQKKVEAEFGGTTMLRSASRNKDN
jgi:hypothetical protein